MLREETAHCGLCLLYLQAAQAEGRVVREAIEKKKGKQTGVQACSLLTGVEGVHKWIEVVCAAFYMMRFNGEWAWVVCTWYGLKGWGAMKNFIPGLPLVAPSPHHRTVSGT